MDAKEWAAELNRLAANGNDVALDNAEAKEIASLLETEQPNGEGD